MKRLNLLLLVALWSIGMSSAFAAEQKLDPLDIGNFDKRQFVAPQQALTLGKDIAEIVGYIGVVGPDGTLTITSCRQIVGDNATITAADLSQPVFSAIIDGSWGLRATLTFLDISDDGNTKISMTATDIADAVLPQKNIPGRLSAPISGCALPPNAALFYVEKATLTLVNKTTYVKNEANGGILNILNINGAEYDQTDQTNMYTVSVFVTPIYYTSSKTLSVAKTAADIENLQGKINALGVNGPSVQFGILNPKFTTALKPATISSNLLETFKNMKLIQSNQ